MEAPGRLGGQNYSPWVTVFNMCNAAIGSGVLSFPFAFRFVVSLLKANHIKTELDLEYGQVF